MCALSYVPSAAGAGVGLAVTFSEQKTSAIPLRFLTVSPSHFIESL